jgi:hypothetical protein
MQHIVSFFCTCLVVASFVHFLASLTPPCLHAQTASPLSSSLGSPLATPAVQQALAQERFRDFVQTMDVVVNDENFTFTGKARVQFQNNTGDTLRSLFFHAHFNAFQPNSPTHRRAEQVGPNRLRPEIFANLQPSEYGKLDITRGTVTGVAGSDSVGIYREWTIIRIDLAKPIIPEERVTFDFEFAGQVPKQIRRSGRMNAEGVRYSMAQWFPKLCQYDQHGWQNNQFVAREFYGVWGKYDVHITLPAKFIVGGSGELQNPREVGHGYEFTTDTTIYPSSTQTPSNQASSNPTSTWHFIAYPAHDFAWTADDDYVHSVVKATLPPHDKPPYDSLTFHVLVKSKYAKKWATVGDILKRTFRFLGTRYLPYPYKTFTATQAGDGGMEYPQLVMVRDNYGSFMGTMIHESIHQWFYGLAADNETKHAWMDEGLTDYMTDRIEFEEFGIKSPLTGLTGLGGDLYKALVPERPLAVENNLFYLNLSRLGNDEPLSLQHDRFNSEAAAVLVYRKGSAFMRQLEYSFGQDKVDALLRTYLHRWKFRHPYPADMEKVAEDVFGQRMDEVFDTFLLGTELPDYAVNGLVSTQEASGKWRTSVNLSKAGRAHVPLNITLTDDTGQTTQAYIPSDFPQILVSPFDKTSLPSISLPAWYWAYNTYTAELQTDRRITSVRLDTTGKLLDPYLPDNYFSNGDNVLQKTDFWRGVSNVMTLGQTPNLFGRGNAQVGWWTRFDEAQPLDYTGVSLRPVLWYNAPGGVQLGLRTDITSNWNRQKFFAGLYYNLRSQSVDWQLGGSSRILSWGKFTGEASFWLGDIDGVFVASSRVRYTSQSPLLWTLKPEDNPVKPSQLAFTFGVDFYNFRDRSYFEPSYTEPQQGLLRILLGMESAWNGGSLRMDAAFATQIVRNGNVIELSPTAFFNAKVQHTFWETPYCNAKVRGLLSMSNSHSIADIAMPALNTASALEQFENMPYRALRFIPTEQPQLRAFMPGGAGLVRSLSGPTPFLATANITLGETKTLEALGVRIPVVSALRPILYAAGGLGLTVAQAKINSSRGYSLFDELTQLDAGVALSLNLNDIIPGSRILWMFQNEVSLSVWLPLVSKLGTAWMVGTDGVRVGISSALN